jgi:hypothetical protein
MNAGCLIDLLITRNFLTYDMHRLRIALSAFLVFWKQFCILLLAPEYKKDKDLQNHIPTALVAIHNFIHHHDPNEEKLPGFDAVSILPHAGDTSTHYLLLLLHSLQLNEMLITDGLQLQKPCGIVIKYLSTHVQNKGQMNTSINIYMTTLSILVLQGC